MRTIEVEVSHCMAYVCDGDEEWLALRNKGIGGSDVSAIMGINKYTTPLEVWLEKTGRADHKDLSDNESVYWGNRLEHEVRDEFARRHQDLHVEEPTFTLVSDARPWAHANLDGILTDSDGNKGILEIKTVGEKRAGDWADGVPDYYMTQVTHYMSVTGWSFAWFAVLVGGQRYVEFYVERDEEDIAIVSDAVDTFWRDFVEKDVMPHMVGTSGESRAIVNAFGNDGGFASPENYAHFDALVEEYRKCKDLESAYKRQATKAANEIRAAIGSHKGAMTDVYKVTWVRSNQTRLDTDRIRSELPDIASRYEKTSMRDGGLRVSGVG